MLRLTVMLARFGLVAGLLVPGLGLPSLAQEDLAPAAILIVDQDRLFAESAFGQASQALAAKAVEALEAENARIQAELVVEEQELTVLRKSLTAQEFSAKAEAFDQKVERIRGEQDSKARELGRRRDEDLKAFFEATAPVLWDILNDRGAEVLMDKTSVILSVPAVDITDEAIIRIDAVLVGPEEVAP